MKEYDIVIEGEHISFESRHLRFGLEFTHFLNAKVHFTLINKG